MSPRWCCLGHTWVYVEHSWHLGLLQRLVFKVCVIVEWSIARSDSVLCCIMRRRGRGRKYLKPYCKKLNFFSLVICDVRLGIWNPSPLKVSNLNWLLRDLRLCLRLLFLSSKHQSVIIYSVLIKHKTCHFKNWGMTADTWKMKQHCYEIGTETFKMAIHVKSKYYLLIVFFYQPANRYQ